MSKCQGFFFFFFCLDASFLFFATAAGQETATFEPRYRGPRWHGRQCPNADLSDTGTICMYALLTRALLTPAALTVLNRSETPAC